MSAVNKFHHLVGAIFLTVALAGCATKPLATATVTAPITGTVNIGVPTPAPIPVVKTIVETCNPPPQFLVKHPPLPLIAQPSLTRAQALNLWLDDIGAYNDLNVDDGALIDWLAANCRG